MSAKCREEIAKQLRFLKLASELCVSDSDDDGWETASESSSEAALGPGPSCEITQSYLDELTGLGTRLTKLGAQLAQINSEIGTALNAVRKQQLELVTKVAKASLRV